MFELRIENAKHETRNAKPETRNAKRRTQNVIDALLFASA